MIDIVVAVISITLMVVGFMTIVGLAKLSAKIGKPDADK